MERLMTLSEVATDLRVSKAAVYRWVADKRLTPTRVGNRLRFSEAAVREFIESSTESISRA